MSSLRRCILGGLLAGPLALCAQPYFQQRVDHVITVRLDDVHHALFAEETITYTNNAPQALDTIWMHLWANAYRDRNTALCRQLDAQNDLSLHFASEADRGSIDSLDFTSDGAKLGWGLHPQHADIAWIKLPRPLTHGERIILHTPFHVKVPSAAISRLGHAGQAYYITQWFPKPAVFDRDGWHAMPYLTQGEFYSEFGSYDVSITLPANYVVGATGEPQDATEQAWMDSLAQLPPSFLLRGGHSDPFPPSSTRLKTVRFKQDDVHDFAWSADKRFQVRKGSVHLKASNRTVTTWVLVTPHNAAMWHDAITYVNESVRLYSEWVGDYPYAACTAIDGGTAAGGGMEYPMFTIINDSHDPVELDAVIAHEVGHNWFYGMLGSNERAHPWMDEGVDSFYEQRYVEMRYPGRRDRSVEGLPIGFLKHEGVPYREHNELLYRLNGRRNWDAPIESPATTFTELDYGATVYAKSALVFDHLFHALGGPMFDRCMQRYFREWRFAHPYSADLRRVFEQTSGQDLTWCFDELLNTANKVDVRAVAIRDSSFTYHSDAVTELPVPLTAWHGADSLGTWWINTTHGTHTVRIPFANADRVRIDALERTLDIDRRNNTTGRRAGLTLKFLSGIERQDRQVLYGTPLIGYNTHDGWMAGGALSNIGFPSQRVEWVLAPLYGFGSQRLAGAARLEWSNDRLRERRIAGIMLPRNLHAGVSAFRASLPSLGPLDQGYTRVVPYVQLDPRLRTTGPDVRIGLRSVILTDQLRGTLGDGPTATDVDTSTTDIFLELSATIERKKGLNPYKATFTALQHEAFSRVSVDASWSAVYDRHKHRITFRGFGGAFLRKDDQLMRPEMGWRLYWGSSDLLYDHLFIDRQVVGRNTAQQFVKDQGGFRTPTAVGTSDTWIAALNMELDFPFLLPLSAFASYGAAPYTRVTPEGRTRDWKGYWEAGIGLRVWRDMIEVWVPLATSEDITKELDLHDIDFTERIRFVFALEQMDPTRALRKAPH